MKRRRNPSQQKRRQQWADIAGICVVIVVLLGSGLYLYARLKTEKPKPPANSVDITWQFDGTAWRSSSAPPACEEPLFVMSPVDTSLATSVLYPGQYRGGVYKPDGGFRFDEARANDITVRLPMDARLTGFSHRGEGGEAQYALTFTNPCGIVYRFDHLRTLSSRINAIVADGLPQSNAESFPVFDTANAPKFAAGEVVATAVGSVKNNNMSMGFGMYDLRKANEISKNVEWASLHAPEAGRAYYGVCWFEQLPVIDADRVAALVAADDPLRAVSDYCATPGGRTR